MPYLTDFKCTKCDHVREVLFKSYRGFLEDQDLIACDKCLSTMERVWLSAPRIIFKEGLGAESSKPLSYWNNAEKVKQNAIKKRQAEETEKKFYKDETTLVKDKNRVINAKRTD